MFYRIILVIAFSLSSSIAVGSDDAVSDTKNRLVELGHNANNKPIGGLAGKVEGDVPQNAADKKISVKGAAPKVGSGILTADPYSVVVGLLAVLALIFGLAWFVRKIGPGSLVGGQSMRIVSVLGVGPREKVLLVDVGGHQILLGVASGRVSHLRDFEEPVIVANDTPGGEFSAKLKHLLRQGDTSTTDGLPSAGSKTAVDVPSHSKKSDSGAGA